MDQASGLRPTVEAWLRAALAVLQERASGGRLRTVVEERVAEDLDTGSWRVIGTRERPDFDELVADYIHELMVLPETVALARLLREDEALRGALMVDLAGVPVRGTDEQATAWLGDLHLRTFLLAYLPQSPDLSFHASAFNDVFRYLDELVRRLPEVPYSALTEFRRGVAMTGAPLELERGVWLRSATREERQKIAETPEHRVSGWMDVPSVFLEVRQPLRAVTWLAERDQFAERVERLRDAALLALRLTGAEPIRLGPTHVKSPNPFLQRLAGGGYRPLDHQGHVFEAKSYSITLERADEIKALWKPAKRAIKDPDLSLALSRFADSYARLDPIDRHIDLWIAMESLFMPDERVAGMAVSMALSLSHYVGKNAHDRRSIYAFAISSHKLRSEIVHGKFGSWKDYQEHVSQQKTLRQVVPKTQDLLRRALVKRISEPV